MNNIALTLGYLLIGVIIYITAKAFFMWVLFGGTQGHTQSIVGKNIFVNGQLVCKTNGGQISVINGSVYENGKLIYEYKRKFRWQK